MPDTPTATAAKVRADSVALLDDALVRAARARRPDAADAVLVDLHIGFVQAATGPLQASAQATGGGRSVCFCEAELHDAQGRLVARAMGTLRYT
jgi:acyl-coenzyme A thioesterase PaaI-like protein